MPVTVVSPGKIIREFREERGWTGSELARRSSLSPAQISKLEKGHENLKYPTLVRIARALNIKPCVFLMTVRDRDRFEKVSFLRWE